MENDIFEICMHLPNTEKIVSDLQNLQVTIDKLLQHIKNVEEENNKLKSELIDSYKKIS